MRYNTELQNNNAELQAILDSVNGLPSAGGNGSSENPYGYMCTFYECFRGVEFPENKELDLFFGEYLKEEQLNANALYATFRETKNLKRIKVQTIPNSIGFNYNMTFYGCSAETIELVNTGVVMSINNGFGVCRNLKQIICELDFSKVSSASGAFTNCTLLEEVRFKKNTIKVGIAFTHSYNLSDESIQSIIDGLANLTNSETQTLTFHADVKAKLTDAQITAITSKNWTLA